MNGPHGVSLDSIPVFMPRSDSQSISRFGEIAKPVSTDFELGLVV